MNRVVILVLIAMSFGSIAQAGAEGSGGGHAVVCRDQKGEIKSAQLLDLYEGRAQYGLFIPESSAPVATQVRDAAWRIAAGNTNFAAFFLVKLQNVTQSLRILPDGTGLKPINDSMEVIVSKDCKIEQLANYLNSHNVLVDGEIWRNLSNTDKAGLLLHESIYATFREYGAKDSRRARRIVSHGFGGFEFADSYGGLEPNITRCASRDTSEHYYEFWVHKKDDHQEIRFTYLDGDPVVSLKAATMSQAHDNFPQLPIGLAESSVMATYSNFEDGDVIYMDIAGPTIPGGPQKMSIHGFSGEDAKREYALQPFSCEKASPPVFGGAAFGDYVDFTVTPSTPILIPNGTTTVNGETITAPFFVANSLNVAWSGEFDVHLLRIRMKTPNSVYGANCTFEGEKLKKIFPSLVDAHGDVVLKSGVAALSTPVACGGINLPTLNGDNVEVPVEVSLEGDIYYTNPQGGLPQVGPTKSSVVIVVR